VFRLKTVFRSAASACALALLMSVAGATGTVLGADQGQGGDVTKIVGEGMPVGPDQTPPGLLGGDPGSGGLDLEQIIPPLLTEPNPDGGGHVTSPDESSPASATPAPAASTPKPKRKAATGKIADARSNRSRSGRTRPKVSSARGQRAAREPKARYPTASGRARGSPGSGKPQSNTRYVSPSIVGRVINRIPTEYQVALVGLGLLSLLFAIVSLRERRRSRRVERQALVDALTALPNRQAFERRLAKEWRRAERYERDIGVLMLDLDDFKQINDGQGHAAGDQVLSEAAVLISGRIRSADMAARWGGDEFVVLCPETNSEGLKVLARSLEDRLRHAGIASSAGFAEREPGDLGPADVLARADVSMYARKQRERARPERRAVTLADARRSFASLSD
jgi:diguanylate cyclase (GGDEF)-like protein